ncbi:MAG TPA: hypothetical protein VMR14_14330 [Streptosporangiaceae bacterium]|nr:hypothetical protein [Streptosporangiaceae bacterium]
MTPPRSVCFPDPVPDRANLYDRSTVLADVTDSLRHRTTVVRGGRLMGKTSLLNVVALAVEDHGKFAIIRLAPTDSRLAFMAEILDGIRQWVDEHRPNSARAPAASRGLGIGRGWRLHAATLPDAAAQAPINTVAQFCQRIARLSEQVTGVVFLLCVDEFDSLIQNWDEHEARLVLELIAHLDTMPKLPVRFLLTLSTIPELVLTSFRSPILNQSKIVILEPWEADDAAGFSEWLVGDQLTFDAAAQAALFAAAGGHPYFTKAVLSALLSAVPGPAQPRPVSPAQVTEAVQQVVRSPEVDLALHNLVGAHLSAGAVAILDRAGNSPSGVTTRGLADLSSTVSLLASLQADGLLRQQGERYLLRLGIWREWRAVTRTDRDKPPLLRRIARTAGRIRSRRLTSWVLITAVVGPLLAVLVTTVFLEPGRTIAMRPCGPAAHLAVFASYPPFASAGDQQWVRVILLNNGPTQVSGSALLSFPANQARADNANGASFTDLRTGQEATLDVPFTTTASAGWLSTSPARVAFQLAVNADGGCRARRWSISVAPIPRLQPIRSVAAWVLGLFLAPLVVEFGVRRLSRDGRGVRISPGVARDS